ncbi:LacI family transcriptional regulator [Intrasporangium calvum]|uniref:LacI family transcriptional regulator n=1 Tax=Intrasporangium calvum TaxID=53358 RepID=A0ABT5GJN9_9MICO|nr:LacI family DNA-binding transcriptional regulator [Intrasporangium calvum]MDC5698216.1 LacI family transcriptional regulator [Intrasporangium calvum]
MAQAASPRRPTIRMVAERAGVSVATVSYVLSGRSSSPTTRVGDETAARVRDAAEALGYVPSSAARAVRTGRTGTVLLSLTMLSDPWSLALVEAVRRATRGTDLTPLVAADADWRPLVRSLQPDVVFIDDADRPGDAALLRTLAASGDRLVVMDPDLAPDGFDVIRNDDHAGCRLLAETLLDRYETVGLLSPNGIARLRPGGRPAAYVEALKARGLPVRPEWCPAAGDDESSAFRAALELLRRADRPQALMATSEYIGQAALGAAGALGLRPGTDIGIASVGNAFATTSRGLGMTSVGPERFFEAVAELLVSRAAGDDGTPPGEHFFEWQVFERESTLGA